MPLVRIDHPATLSPEACQAAAESVYQAMVQTLNVPEKDRFVILQAHTAETLQIDSEYLGIPRGPGALVVQVTLNAGRSTEMKKAFYARTAALLQQTAGIRPEDVLISLVEVTKDNWSFGYGEAQYA